ncbi:MAG: hypothetical protein K5696_04075 [Lachnospiraceae bacterium]|nr:hypothetical protein [Lachnospiraceae bacterium]
MEKNTNELPPWAEEMSPDDFISHSPTYESGKYFHLFEKSTYRDGSGTELKYYTFDPDRDAKVKRKLPLLVFLHGTGNSLVGDLCINYTGAEFYATDDYQKSMGGARILIPVANEYRDEDGRTRGQWNPDYLEPVHNLIMSFKKERSEIIGPVILLGNSSGATFVMRLMDNYMDDFDVVIPVGSGDLPGDSTLDEYDRKGKTLFFAFGRRDEFNDYCKYVEPRLPRLEKMKHCFIFIPEWVRNGDKGVASINFGFEMGQHCLINSVHANLMFDDGTPMDDRLPNGMTGWISQVVRDRMDR